MAEAVRVVLDTNVLLSLFVFADSRYALLRERLEAGALLALSDSRCIEELRRVLAYPLFSLDSTAQAAVLTAYAELVVVVPPAHGGVVVLPQCQDADDQKFLEVARDGQADWLVTSDKALLKLARRQRLAHLFRILTPQQALEIVMARLAAGA
jgi:putative PIN family toxin of toxin-antitoxin system